MQRALMTLLVTVLIAGPSGGAETVLLDSGTAALSVELVSSDIERTVIEYGLGAFSMADVDIDSRAYKSVVLEGESRSLERGLPELPNVARSIVIPGDARMSIRVVSSHYVEFTDMDIAPSRGPIPRNVDPSTVGYEFDPLYESDTWYPARLAYARDPYLMRDVRGMTVVVNPFRYNPSTRTLRVYDRIVIEAERVGTGNVNVLDDAPFASPPPEFAGLYSGHFLNYEDASRMRYNSVGEVGDMLIIAYDGFLEAMGPFVEWKLQAGLHCEMVGMSQVGSTAADVATYISDYYDAHDLTYVLLVGDGDEVPSLQKNGGASDPSYSLVAGNDIYPDIFVGRFSAESVSQVETQVLRSIEYEKTPQSGGDWYHMGTGIASASGPGDDGEFDDEHVDNIRTDLLTGTYTEVDRIYDPSATSSMVAAALNSGRSVINYTGHGHTIGWSTSSFTSSDVNALENDNMLPFIWSVACLNGNFDESTCFAEVWMRATNGSEPTGAVATYMSSINQDWDEPMDAQDEIADLLVAGAKRTFGGLSLNGACHMLDEYGVYAENDFLAWHIFGDPSLRVRTDSPAVLSVDHADTTDPALWTFEVTVDGVEGALCALYRQGVSYGSAFTNAAGVALIDIEGVLPSDMEATVTVTAPNALPYFGTVLVSQAYSPIIDVSPASLEVTLEPGETWTGGIEIANAGEPLSVLHYEASLVDAGMTRGANDSRMLVSPESYDAGTTEDFVFALANGSSDGQWVDGASLSLPEGVRANSCTGFRVADRTLACDGVSGDGTSVTWTGDWWNVVYPGEVATATVNLTIDPGADKDLEIIYGLAGDGVGSPPHALSGTMILDGVGQSVLTVHSPNGQEVWGVGDTRNITWEPTGGPITVDIFCSIDGGANWIEVVSATEDDGQYEWPVDVPVSDNCLMRVVLTVDHSVGDTGDASFSVYQPVDWISVSSLMGDVVAGSSDTMTIDVVTGDMVEGDHSTDIVVLNNGGGLLTIPVNLHVRSAEADLRIPRAPTLYGNYPNPFNPVTRIGFSLPRSMRVRISIFTVGGRLVRVLADDLYAAGRHSEPWDGRDRNGLSVASGVYFYSLEAGSADLVGKMVILK